MDHARALRARCVGPMGNRVYRVEQMFIEIIVASAGVIVKLLLVCSGQRDLCGFYSK